MADDGDCEHLVGVAAEVSTQTGGLAGRTENRTGVLLSTRSRIWRNTSPRSDCTYFAPRMGSTPVSSQAMTCWTRKSSPNTAPHTAPPWLRTSVDSSENTPPDEENRRRISSFARTAIACG